MNQSETNMEAITDGLRLKDLGNGKKDDQPIRHDEGPGANMAFPQYRSKVPIYPRVHREP